VKKPPLPEPNVDHPGIAGSGHVLNGGDLGLELRIRPVSRHDGVVLRLRRRLSLNRRGVVEPLAVLLVENPAAVPRQRDPAVRIARVQIQKREETRVGLIEPMEPPTGLTGVGVVNRGRAPDPARIGQSPRPLLKDIGTIVLSLSVGPLRLSLGRTGQGPQRHDTQRNTHDRLN
jgi:hypothetical protein